MSLDDPRIIVFEGLDGVGKTTLARRLSRYTGWFYVRALDGAHRHMLMTTVDPRVQAAIVYAGLAPRAWHCAKITTPCVFDRYAYSLAYQVARGLDPTIAIRILSSLPRPDVVVFIRGGCSDMSGVDERRVVEAYMALLGAAPPRALYVANDVIEAAAALVRAGVVSASVAARLASMRLPEFIDACRKRGMAEKIFE